MPAFRRVRAQGMKPFEHTVEADEIDELDVEATRPDVLSARAQTRRQQSGRSAEARVGPFAGDLIVHNAGVLKQLNSGAELITLLRER